ncbi:MAG: M20/M25/M40 family metallo-hydrolase [Bacteroidetes bacterium]|nr:M20/M25/M40 family metallo-hydrolase [Bacteroidota bacterium]
MINKFIVSGYVFFAGTIPVLSQKISVDNLRSHITCLSSDSMEGRGTATKGEQMAAQYIQKNFHEMKLMPKGKNNSYLYDFTFKKNPNPHDTSTVDIPVRKGINVIGFLDNKSEYTVVIGGHYDHLGKGGDGGGSLEANSEGMIHNGADDNASGTAGVLELARYFTANNRTEKFNFLFICFSGEELGLYGSKKFCDSPTVDLKTINYMVNMDMIGRLSDSTHKVVVYGVGTSTDMIPLLDKIPSDLKIIKDSSGIGPSDQTSFYLKDIPVLHFFTGQHKDYHKPSDDADKINYDGEKKILEYIVQFIEETEKLPKMKFTPTRSKQEDTPRFKVTLGIMPDYTFEGKGVRVDGVTKGKPASNAGIEKEDIIIQLGEKKTENMMDYMKALAGFAAGDSAEAVVMRKGQEVKLRVKF